MSNLATYLPSTHQAERTVVGILDLDMIPGQKRSALPLFPQSLYRTSNDESRPDFRPQSELGRTPTCNKGNGKDHWSIGSILFLGKGIKGNRAIGATDDKQLHVPLNPQTLARDKKGIRIRPEHVHTALRELAGIADHAYSNRFPLGVKDRERLHGLWG